MIMFQLTSILSVRLSERLFCIRLIDTTGQFHTWFHPPYATSGLAGGERLPRTKIHSNTTYGVVPLSKIKDQILLKRHRAALYQAVQVMRWNGFLGSIIICSLISTSCLGGYRSDFGDIFAYLNRFCRRAVLRSMPSRIMIKVAYSISMLLPGMTCGKRKVPFGSILYHITKPFRSQNMILRRLPRWFRKTNSCPLIGSRPMKDFVTPYSPLKPIRMSVGRAQK